MNVRSFALLLLVAFFLVSFANAQDNAKQASGKKQDVAVIKTNVGTIVFKFLPDSAPNHMKNFIKLAKKGFYNGLTFHRVIPGFMIQGGDPLSKDKDRSNDGTGGPGYTIPAEIKAKHGRGAVAAARLGDTVNPKRESSGSQFYICVGECNWLDGQYTVFGRVIEGMDIVDKIANMPRDKRDNPLQPVVMESVTIEKRAIK